MGCVVKRLISVITLLEVVKVCQQAQATGRMQRFLNAESQEEVLSLEAPAADLAGMITGDLDRTGQTIGMADPIITANALEHDLDLVTGNFAHFQRIIRLGYPLTLVNWR
jgi:tRNA(fMet)-specific endonuclease VapC